MSTTLLHVTPVRVGDVFVGVNHTGFITTYTPFIVVKAHGERVLLQRVGQRYTSERSYPEVKRVWGKPFECIVQFDEQGALIELPFINNYVIRKQNRNQLEQGYPYPAY